MIMTAKEAKVRRHLIAIVPGVEVLLNFEPEDLRAERLFNPRQHSGSRLHMGNRG